MLCWGSSCYYDAHPYASAFFGLKNQYANLLQKLAGELKSLGNGVVSASVCLFSYAAISMTASLSFFFVQASWARLRNLHLFILAYYLSALSSQFGLLSLNTLASITVVLVSPGFLVERIYTSWDGSVRFFCCDATQRLSDRR